MCRVLPPLTRLLAETASRWARALAPIAERATHGEDHTRPRRPIRLPTPLTEAKRRAGRNAVRRRQRSEAQAPSGSLSQNCQTCGTMLRVTGRMFCDTCIPDPKTAISKCHNALQGKRAQGKDPAHGGSAAIARGARRVESQRAITEWEAKNPTPLDQETYFRDVLPRLQGVSVPAIVRATGLSYPYCAMIRRGHRVPHPMHWNTLKVLIIGGQTK